MKSLATQLKEFQGASEKACALADDLDELVESVAGFERPAPTSGAGGGGAGGAGTVSMGSGGSSTIHEPGTLDLLETQAVRISGHHARIETAIKRLGELLG